MKILFLRILKLTLLCLIIGLMPRVGFAEKPFKIGASDEFYLMKDSAALLEIFTISLESLGFTPEIKAMPVEKARALMDADLLDLFMWRFLGAISGEGTIPVDGLLPDTPIYRLASHLHDCPTDTNQVDFQAIGVAGYWLHSMLYKDLTIPPIYLNTLGAVAAYLHRNPNSYVSLPQQTVSLLNPAFEKAGQPMRLKQCGETPIAILHPRYAMDAKHSDIQERLEREIIKTAAERYPYLLNE
jgi:hypothetical protein